MYVFIYVSFAVFVTVILAGEARDKKDAIYYHPNGQVIADFREYLPSAGYNNYYNYKQPYYQSPYTYNQEYYLQQPYQRYNNYQYNLHPYGYQQVNPYSYQNDYNNGYQNRLNSFVVRQAPIYPSPGAQPLNPPVPPPFYHPPGTYYPVPITDKPITVAPKI